MSWNRSARRWLQGLAGAVLIAAGLSGLSWTWQATPVYAQRPERGSHQTMHEMMDAMHGRGTAERMHAVEGADEMMDACASMLDAMGGAPGTGSMMRGGMSSMDSMMGSSGTGSMMGPS